MERGDRRFCSRLGRFGGNSGKSGSFTAGGSGGIFYRSYIRKRYRGWSWMNYFISLRKL